MAKWLRTLLAILAHRKFAAVFQSAPGYTGSGVAYTDPTNTHASSIGIVLTVTDQSSIAQATAYILSAIGPVTYLGITIALRVNQKAKPELQAAHSGHYIEFVGAVSYGTIGAIFPTTDGMKLLSCSHVLANGGMVPPGQRVETFVYPGSYQQLGTLIDLSLAVLHPDPARVRVDAALVLMDSGAIGIPRVVEYLQDPTTASTPVTAEYRRFKRCTWHWWNALIDHWYEATLLGDPVLKIGHATARTDGYISAVDVSFTTHHAGLPLTYERHIQVAPNPGGMQAGQPFSGHGDSGAMVIATENNRALGLIVAGDGTYSYFSKITEIMDHYSIREI